MLEILGEPDVQTAPQPRAFLGHVTAATSRHLILDLILDLTGVRFLASSGIALLIAASGKDGINGRLHLLGLTGNHSVERPLALVGLLERFDRATLHAIGEINGTASATASRLGARCLNTSCVAGW